MGMHGHSHSGVNTGSRWWDFPLDDTGRWLAAAAIATLALTVVGVLVLWPSVDAEIPAALGTVGVERLNVDVTTVVTESCVGNPDAPIQCETINFSLPDGSTGNFQQTPSIATPNIADGDPLVVADQGPDIDPSFRYYFLDFQRTTPLLLLAGIFALAVVVLGRLQGVRSLVALLISFGVLLWFTLPALLETSSPVLVAIIGSAAVATVTLYLTHGVNHLTTVSLIGSLASLSLTGFLAWLFVDAARLTGLSDEDSLYLLVGNDQLDIRGVLLAGMIIGTIGVLDDVTVTQSAAVAEIHHANPHMAPRRLYQSALRVGRDHIGSTTNTLVFAYAGAALPLLMLLTQAQLPLGRALTSEIIAVEVIRALVGGVGLIASVPVTTALATWVVRASARRDHNDHDVEPVAATPVPVVAEDFSPEATDF